MDPNALAARAIAVPQSRPGITSAEIAALPELYQRIVVNCFSDERFRASRDILESIFDQLPHFVRIHAITTAICMRISATFDQALYERVLGTVSIAIRPLLEARPAEAIRRLRGGYAALPDVLQFALTYQIFAVGRSRYSVPQGPYQDSVVAERVASGVRRLAGRDHLPPNFNRAVMSLLASARAPGFVPASHRIVFAPAGWRLPRPLRVALLGATSLRDQATLDNRRPFGLDPNESAESHLVRLRTEHRQQEDDRVLGPTEILELHEHDSYLRSDYQPLEEILERQEREQQAREERQAVDNARRLRLVYRCFRQYPESTQEYLDSLLNSRDGTSSTLDSVDISRLRRGLQRIRWHHQDIARDNKRWDLVQTLDIKLNKQKAKHRKITRAYMAELTRFRREDPTGHESFSRHCMNANKVTKFGPWKTAIASWYPRSLLPKPFSTALQTLNRHMHALQGRDFNAQMAYRRATRRPPQLEHLPEGLRSAFYLFHHGRYGYDFEASRAAGSDELKASWKGYSQFDPPEFESTEELLQWINAGLEVRKVRLQQAEEEIALAHATEQEVDKSHALAFLAVNDWSLRAKVHLRLFVAPEPSLSAQDKDDVRWLIFRLEAMSDILLLDHMPWTDKPTLKRKVCDNVDLDFTGYHSPNAFQFRSWSAEASAKVTAEVSADERRPRKRARDY